jgi:hypothetical protein
MHMLKAMPKTCCRTVYGGVSREHGTNSIRCIDVRRPSAETMPNS